MVAYSFKQRFVTPIRIGLGATDLLGHPKRQTIRGPRVHHAVTGDRLQLYCAQRTRHCFMIGEAVCVDSSPIAISLGVRGYIDCPGIGILTREHDLSDFARSDGFADWEDMRAFWNAEHPGVERFEGTLIRWQPLVHVDGEQ